EPEAALATLITDYQTGHKIVVAVTEKGQEERKEIEFNYAYVQKSIDMPLPKFDEQPPQVMSNLKSFPSYSLDITYKSNGKKEQNSQLLIKSDRIDIQVGPESAKTQPLVFLGAYAMFNSQEE